jgi:hypothetical protein
MMASLLMVGDFSGSPAAGNFQSILSMVVGPLWSTSQQLDAKQCSHRFGRSLV